ncbi:PIG-L family deacetylase [Flavobacterium azooxidireducens]|uniref:PIG-L family deacetylase n=1 Tax=Flavobacterium azooxidireducens TaxID=1871076 RepID=A0ABY4KI23_9FLAO|nr:PIG-L family deacetylase [Flavobacterium azooxidireducens]UPQ79060.1 PIG-L family deacetylase [Flavobacterium azooxidireducens]
MGLKKYFILLLLLFASTLLAQQPQKPSSVEIYHQIQKLNFLGSVLYVAAHPDDENTRLISYMANHVKARTGYLSITRGDGGQNLIGTELRELLGVIRTQELLEARKIDGGEQFFTRANDFGFSKVPDETLKIWNKNEVLEDMIYIIRKFKPDVIINRFDHRSPGTTHGHHTSSAMLSIELFDQTNDPKVYPNQLKFTSTWQPKRLFFNTSWWFYGGKEKFDKADKSKLNNFDMGVYYPSFGKSNQEIAALSRSRHQSQGFGSTGSRGDEIEYLELIKGEAAKDNKNIFEGIDTSWNRVKGGAEIGKLVTQIEKDFDFRNPSASIPKLIEAYTLIQKLDDEHWKKIKAEEIKKIISGCAGLFLEAVAESQSSTPGSTLKVRIEAINRSNQKMVLNSINTNPSSITAFSTTALKNNQPQYIDLELNLDKNEEYTAPYWLKEQGTVGMYAVSNQENIGIPDIIRTISVTFLVEINGTVIPFEREVIYKYNDEVKGEVYKPFDVVPVATSSILDKVKIFNSEKNKSVGVKIKAGKDDVSGNAFLTVAQGWKVSPESIPFQINKKGGETTVYFEVTPPKNSAEITATSYLVVDGEKLDKEQINIQYEHIAQQQVLANSEAKFSKLDIIIKNEKIAYIMGAGDEVPLYLSQMGYEVTILKPEEITLENLQNFQVVVMGIRAYNTVDELSFKQQLLFDFVKNGNTMIVQYNTTGKLTVKELAPFSLKLSRDRVTEEDAEVRFLAPNHKIVNFPNKITSNDFKGWVQEQGLYYPNEWDATFTPILSSNDKGEDPKNGGLLVAQYGKGYYIYTGLSFFRELPAGVSGAYRLFANMISIGTKTN